MLAQKLLAATSGAEEKLYVDDCFSSFVYTGNGSTQTINNGIDLAGKGGMVWGKTRNSTEGHEITDTLRGSTKNLYANSTSAQQSFSDVTGFNSNGYSLGYVSGAENTNTFSYVSWTFRKSAKFFDCVTYTGNGVAGRQISHALGTALGMVICKSTSGAGAWQIWHRGLTSGNYVQFTTAAQSTANAALNFGNDSITIDPTATVFTVGTSANLNSNGVTYVAYLFAHDASTDGIIQCGSFTTDGSGNATVNHGWSAGVQFAAIKASSTTGDWEMYDTARTAAWSGSDARLRSNLISAEDSLSRLSASGTSISFSGLSTSATYVYLFVVAPT